MLPRRKSSMDPTAYPMAAAMPTMESIEIWSRGASNEPFPRRLHRMLCETEGTPDEMLVRWVDNRHFKVVDLKQFERELLPRYFHSIKYKSFTRQLNLYKFERVRDIGPLHGCYRHALFYRDRPDLVDKISRKQKDPSSPKPRHTTFLDTSLPPAVDLDQFPTSFAADQAVAVARRPSILDSFLPDPLGGQPNPSSIDAHDRERSVCGAVGTNSQSRADLSIEAPTTSDIVQQGSFVSAHYQWDRQHTSNSTQKVSTDDITRVRFATTTPTKAAYEAFYLDWISRVPEDIQEEIVRTFLGRPTR